MQDAPSLGTVRFAKHMGWPIEKAKEVLDEYEDILDEVIESTANMSDVEFYALRDREVIEHERALKARSDQASS